MASSTYNAGIIGLGFIGAADQISGDALGQQVKDLDGTHLHAIENNPCIKLVAGSSRDDGRRNRFYDRTGAHTYSDWQEMLDKEDLDLVCIATYAPVHKEITVACADYGIRVIFCEKPIAPYICDAEHMVQACKKSGSLLVINHNRRFNPNYRRLRDFIVSGQLGDLTSVNAQWGNGRLGNVGTHVLDAICMVTGRRIEAVSGTLDVAGKPDCRGSQFRDPGGWGLMQLSRGPIVTVDASDYGKVPISISFQGTKGRVFTGGDDVIIESWNGEREQWLGLRKEATSMDRAVTEIGNYLDGSDGFSYQAEEAVHVLEAIVAFHASDKCLGSWTKLPLSGENRKIKVNSG